MHTASLLTMRRLVGAARAAPLPAAVLAATYACRGFASAAAAPPPAAPIPVAFVAGVTMIPEKEKVARGSKGEDACFVTATALGVADGVGGWAEMGVDSGLFSRALMEHTKEAVLDAELNGVDPDPKGALTAGFKATLADKAVGGTTACLAIACADGRVRVLNLGDSGAMVWRHERVITMGPPAPLRLEEAEKLWTMPYATAPQTFSFNFPNQLDHQTKPSHIATTAHVDDLALQYGDLVILGTDGLYDNVYTHEVKAMLARFDFKPVHDYVRMRKGRVEALRAHAATAAAAAAAASSEASSGAGATPAKPAGKPLERLAILSVAPAVATDTEVAAKEHEVKSMLGAISSLLALSAQRVGNDPTALSPFAKEARTVNRQWANYIGGKPDDITVIAAIVVPDDSRAI